MTKAKRDDWPPCMARIHLTLSGGSSGLSATITTGFRCLLPKAHRGRHKSEIEGVELKPQRRQFIPLYWLRDSSEGAKTK